jgi:hypothetical protein
VSHVAAAVEAAIGRLEPLVDKDWTVSAGTLRWTCWQTAAHIAHDLTGYAFQLAGQPPDRYYPIDLTVRDSATPADLLTVIGAAGGLLATVVDGASGAARAWHWGPTDATGFDAMGVAETILHTFDITSGLGAPWPPPAGLASVVLQRLFPEAPAGEPTAVLLWCTGRGDLPGRDRRTEWVWMAARG